MLSLPLLSSVLEPQAARLATNSIASSRDTNFFIFIFPFVFLKWLYMIRRRRNIDEVCLGEFPLTMHTIRFECINVNPYLHKKTQEMDNLEKMTET